MGLGSRGRFVYESFRGGLGLDVVLELCVIASARGGGITLSAAC